MKYRSDIDGLRAVAIIPVVLYHAAPRLAPGGFVGVDVFFVISGYLITSIIRGELDAGNFSLGSFYERRIRRIFPALFFMLACSCALAVLLLPPGALVEFARTLRSTILFMSNVQFFRTSGYFAGDSELKPLLHTWSLAVEEQFYICFPVLMIVIQRWFRPQLAWILSAIAVLALANSLWTFNVDPNAAFYLTPSRAIELLIGSLLAVSALPKSKQRLWRELITGLGLAVICICVLAYTSITPFPGWHALLPCVGAALIIYGGRDGTSFVTALLSVKPVRYIGAISYALYLWHWPLLVFARHYTFGELTGIETTLVVALAILMAALSGRFIELPFRRPAAEGNRRRVFAAAAACTVSLAALGTVALAANGLPQRFSSSALAMFRFSDSYNHRRFGCHSIDYPAVPYERSCKYGALGVAPSIAVWGDSFGAELVVGLGDLVRDQGAAVLQLSSSACPPAIGYIPRNRPHCADHNKDVLTHLVADKAIQNVVLVARYEQYLQDDWADLSAGLRATVATLARNGKNVTLVYPVPTFHYPVPDALGELVTRGARPTDLAIARSEYLTTNTRVIADLNAIALQFHAARIDPTERFCDASLCRAYDGQSALYWDDAHVSLAGSELLAGEFRNVLRSQTLQTRTEPASLYATEVPSNRQAAPP